MGGSISSHFVGLPGGLMMSVIAFSTVFLVIVGLMLMMMALKMFAISVEGKQKSAAPVAAAPTAQPSSNPPAAAQAASDDSELIAAITAAIYMTCGVAARIVSFTPAPPRTSSSPWRMTGVLQNSEGFLN